MPDWSLLLQLGKWIPLNWQIFNHTLSCVFVFCKMKELVSLGDKSIKSVKKLFLESNSCIEDLLILINEPQNSNKSKISRNLFVFYKREMTSFLSKKWSGCFFRFGKQSKFSITLTALRMMWTGRMCSCVTWPKLSCSLWTGVGGRNESYFGICSSQCLTGQN